MLFQPLENRLDVVAKRSHSRDHPTDANSRPVLQQQDHAAQNIPKQTHHGFKRPWEETTPVTSAVREFGGGVQHQSARKINQCSMMTSGKQFDVFSNLMNNLSRNTSSCKTTGFNGDSHTGLHVSQDSSMTCDKKPGV